MQLRITKSTGRGVRLAAVASSLAFAACSNDMPTERVASTIESIPTALASSTADPSTGTLGVGISSVANYRTEGPITFSTSASGGVGPYTYDWFVQYCYWDGSCTNPNLYSSETTSGGSSISVHATMSLQLFRVSVHVRDSQSYNFTGWSQKQVINLADGSADPESGFDQACELPAGWYPSVDSTGHFRRNVCTGTKEYQPIWP